jgi:integrase
VFTDKFIKGLKPESTKYYQREGEGFTVRVMPSGAKTWLLIYSFDGKRREMNLGSYPDVKLATAREKHAAAKKLLNNGTDPGAVEREAKTARDRTPFVADFVTEYIENHAKKHNKGWKEIERALNAGIVPKWGKRKITDIKRRDLVVLLDEIEKRAPIMANRTLAYTRKLFSYAVKRDVLEVNPFMGMEAPAPSKVRERNLSFAEIKALWTNLDTSKMSDNISRALKLLLVTGQRPGEVIGIHTSEIEGSWWTIPEERSKNKQAHRVFLTPLALEIIGGKEGYIFESPSNPGESYEVRTLTWAIKENLPHTPESKVIDYLKIPHFVPHDLRRTVTSRMAEIGVFEDTIDRVQNHVSRVKSGVRKNYNHYAYDLEKQQALETWERKLTAITTGTEGGKVIAMRRKAVPA